MNRQAQAVVMLLVGGAILRASLTDMYLRYVKAGLQPFLIIAGALMVITAVMTLWYEFRGPSGSSAKGGADDGPGARPRGEHAGHGHAGHGHDGHGHDDGHGHSHEPAVAWLLLLPVFALLLVAPPALGSYAANRTGTALQQPQTSDFPALPDGDPAKISVLDYASRAVFDQGRSIGQRRVELTGFVVAGPTGEPFLARMILSCCAADARPIKVGLTGQVPAGLKADTWLVVTGVYTPKLGKDGVNGEKIPYLDVQESHQVPAPTEQYES